MSKKAPKEELGEVRKSEVMGYDFVTALEELCDHLSALSELTVATYSDLYEIHRLILPERAPEDLEETFIRSGMGRYYPFKELTSDVDEVFKLQKYTNGKPMKRAHHEAVINVVLLLTASRFLGNALYLQDAGLESRSWKHLFESRKMAAALRGRLTVKSVHHASMKGLDTVHIENRAAKLDVFSWLDSHRIVDGKPNFDRKKGWSMDATAELISRTIVKVAVRTARDYVSEWKKLRSTDRP